MTDVRWEGIPHEEIYALVQTGPGAAASHDAVGAWGTVASTMRSVDDQLRQAIRKINEGWEGPASAGARGGMATLSSWALDAADNSVLTQDGVAAQAGSAQQVRNAMPPPQPSAELDKAVAIGAALRMGSTDVGAIEDRLAADRARAVDLMNKYTSDSTAHQHLMNYWTQPPTVVVEAAPRGARPVGAGSRVGGGAGLAAAAVGAGAGGDGPPGGPSAVVPRRPVTPGPGSVGGSTAVEPTGVPSRAAGPPGGGSGAALPGGGSPNPGGPDPRGLPPPPGPLGVPGPGSGSPGPGRAGLPDGPAPRTRLPAGQQAGGFRPIVPGPPEAPPGAALGQRGGTPEVPPRASAGGPAEGVGGRLPEAAAGERGLPGRGAPEGGHGFFPLGGGAAGAGDQEHRRPGFLVDDTDAFADDRWFTPPVIGADDLGVSRV